MAIFVGGVVLGVRLWDAGLPIVEGLQAAGLQRLAIAGFVQLLLPALISLVISLAAVLVLLPSAEARRLRITHLPPIVVAVLVLFYTTILTFLVLAFTGQTFSEDGMDAVYVTATDRTGALEELEGVQGQGLPGDVMEQVCDQRNGDTRLYRCAGRLVATDGGAIVLGSQDALIRIPALDVRYFNVLPGDTLHGWEDD